MQRSFVVSGGLGVPERVGGEYAAFIRSFSAPRGPVSQERSRWCSFVVSGCLGVPDRAGGEHVAFIRSFRVHRD